MRSNSILKNYLLFFHAGAIAAHANARPEGFRQREFTFCFELLLQWSCVEKVEAVCIHNTQALRYLESLVREGFARKTSRGPRYRLTRLGLLELLQRIVTEGESLGAQEFYFLYYFLSTYRERIQLLIAKEGAQFPESLRLEILAVLDAEELLRKEIRRTDREIEKIETYMRDAREGSKLFQSQRARGLSIEEAGLVVEKRYPYQLNYQKPLSKLLREIPSDIAELELSTGAERRVELLFHTRRQILLRHRENLRQMRR